MNNWATGSFLRRQAGDVRHKTSTMTDPAWTNQAAVPSNQFLEPIVHDDGARVGAPWPRACGAAMSAPPSTPRRPRPKRFVPPSNLLARRAAARMTADLLREVHELIEEMRSRIGRGDAQGCLEHILHCSLGLERSPHAHAAISYPPGLPSMLRSGAARFPPWRPTGSERSPRRCWAGRARSCPPWEAQRP